MRPIRWFAAVCLMAGGGFACGSETTNPPQPVPTSLALSTTSVNFAALGATQQVAAVVRDQNDQPITGATVTFASSNLGVATVSPTGLITAVANGSANVTVTHGSLSGQIAVSVAQVVTEVVKTAGDMQTGEVAAELGTALEVQLRDARGNAVPGGVPNTTVQFVTADGGSVSPPSIMADGNGRASTMWTLGTGAGTQLLTASVQGGTASAAFVATATAGAADTVVKVSGDNQTAPNATELPDSLVVRVEDQYGNPVSGHQVEFSATSGGGAVNPLSMPTGMNGEAWTRWTLGATLGAQAAQAQTTPALSGSPVAFTATATDLSLISVAPDTIVEGASATLAGTGFDPTPGNNTVMIDGVSATVTMASPTSLTVTVPSFSCQPARGVDVQVTVGGSSTNTLSHPLNPPSIVSLSVGQQQIVLDPANFCLQFAASPSSEAYLIGVQSLSETPSNLTPTRLLSATGFPSPAPSAAVAPFRRPGATARGPEPSSRQERWIRHRAAETRVRDADFRAIRSRPTAALLGRSARVPQVIIPGTVNVGDTVKNVRVWDLASNCTGFDSIAVVVRAKGTRGIWVEDTANPINGYTVTDFDSLSNYFDNIIFDTDTSYFGDPGDLDGNDRIAIVVTKEVNRRSTGPLGFVGSCDFFSRASAPTSNEGEFFYAKAPDVTGTFGSVYSRNDAFADAPFLIAHEFSHIVQFGRRLPLGGAVFTSWLLEGQATFAEEVNGFAVTGRMPGQNYGFAVAFNNPPSTPIDWHVGAFTDLALYYGFETSTTRKPEAPHECTWIGRSDEGNNGPCIPEREVYGVPYSLYRWISDQFGSGFTGGERGFHKAIIGNPAGGYAAIAGTVGVSIDTLLAQWAASLYVDDRVPGAAARLTIPSWDLVDIESNLFATARLQPIEVLFSTFDQARNVRGGSTAYFRISGTSRPATAVRARSSSDTALPGTMNIWIVRLQ